jgi:uncharacterized integral membrane protein
MVRAIVLLVILASLALFVLQNLAPLPLVILGLQTQALPLGVWVLGAIGAGAFSTLVISTFFKVSNSFATPRPRRRPTATRPAERVASTTASSWSPPWSSSPPKPKASSTSSASRYASTRSGDDWEPRPPLEEWEDWDGYEQPTPPPPKANASSQSYSQSPPTSEPYRRYNAYEPTPPVEEPEEWDDWDEYESDPADREPVDRAAGDRRSREDVDDEVYQTRRTDFEVKQEPKSRSQSGSVYSYSYRGPDEAVEKEDVYDAEYRVITPPYRPEEETPEPIDSASSRTADDWEDGEDWGDEEDGETSTRPEDKGDRPVI